MIEKDASTKWCPMVRLSMTDYDKHNRVAVNRFLTDDQLEDGEYHSGFETGADPDFSCIGSHCAMWVPDTETTGHCGMIYYPAVK
jgi:hypothetical protein